MFIRNKSGHFVTGLFSGALVGVATGLLFARRPGPETRHELKHKASHYVGNLWERFMRGSNGHSAEDHVKVNVGPSH